MVSSGGEPLFLNGGIGGWDFRTSLVVIILNSGLVLVPPWFHEVLEGLFPKVVPTYG